MSSELFPYLLGGIEIDDSRSLDDTAQILSQALDAPFVKELSGRFEEFPAYVGKALFFEFALLGVPDPEFDIRELPTPGYELQIRSTVDAPPGLTETQIDVTLVFVEFLRVRGINCRPVAM